MDDLISRSEAIKAVHEEFDECLVWDESGEYTADEVERILDRVPSAQPERKIGRWKMQSIKGNTLIYCSECGFGKHINETRRYSYCPNCGAEISHDD